MTLPPLDGVAQAYSTLVCSVPHSQHENASAHIAGTHSVYEMKFTLIAQETNEFRYIGNTARPTKRPSEHVSEFLRCSVKTHHGKSKLYDPKYMTGLIAIRFNFVILESGFETEAAAEQRAREVASELAILHTQEFMLSNQNRGRGKDLRPRFSRQKRSSAQ